MPTFTQEQVEAIFQAITCGDSALIEQFAKAAINSAADVHGDMFADVEDGISPPDLNMVRGSAVAYVEDMVGEFTQLVTEKINSIKCSKVTRLKIDIKFEQ